MNPKSVEQGCVYPRIAFGDTRELLDILCYSKDLLALQLLFVPYLQSGVRREADSMKDILGYEGLYKIDKEGNIWSPQKATGNNGYVPAHFLKSTIETIGYKCVGLTKDKKVIKKRIHRLLAQAFIPNPLNLPEVNHKNAIKLDNRLENLEWCTHKHNMAEAGRLGLMKVSAKNKFLLRNRMLKRLAKMTEQEISEMMRHRAMNRFNRLTPKEKAEYFAGLSAAGVKARRIAAEKRKESLDT